MNPTQLLDTVRTKLQGAATHFQEELKKLRTGRAHPSMLDGVTVAVYGTSMPINQVANVTAPEPQLLQITPFDPNNLPAITAAIRENQTLGLNPSDDGRVVRVAIPPLTTERRQQIVKQLGEKVEESMIAMRAARHDALRSAEQAKKDKQMSEDDFERLEKQIDGLMSTQKNEVDRLAKAKEAEIMTV